MKKNLFIICLTLSSIGTLFSQAPGYAWIKTSISNGDPKVSNVGGIAVDTINQFVYATGSINGSGINFGNGQMQTSSSLVPYLVKYNLDGTLIWAKTFDSGDDNTATGVGVDNVGNVYVCGYSQNDTVRFGSQYLLNSHSGSTDHTVGYLVKLDANGNTLWIKGSAGGGGVICEAVAVDALGNSYMTGHVFDDSGTFMGNSTIDGAFFAKISASGALTWFKQTAPAGPLISQGISIALDHAGNFLVCGTYASDVNFGTVALAYQGGGSGTSRRFAAKMDCANGNCTWAVAGNGSGPDYNYDITTDLQNNVYLTGVQAGQGYHLIEKLDPSSGASQWLNTYPNGYLSNITSVTTDKHGNIFATFNVSDTTVYGTYTVNTTAPYANTSVIMVIVKFDATGNVLYAKASSDPVLLSLAEANSSAIDANGNLYINASVSSECKFDGTDINNGSTNDEFALLKLGNVGGGTVGIKTQSNSQRISVYPNPANKTLYISSVTEKSSVKLSDLSGKIILETTVSPLNKAIDISMVTSGAYLLEVNKGGTVSHQKIIVAND